MTTMIVQQDENGQTYVQETSMFGMFLFMCKDLNWSKEEIKKNAQEMLEIYKNADETLLEENEKDFIKNLKQLLEEIEK